ncbi:MAG: hypothetical protein CMQ05_13100 [Gammaproteobacteria bacterium]|nr:hypothetical protein [Gammaproteobacteria bacterium]RPG25292.1 MAG: hypothetical protein CBC10_009320 [Gammaproteobacteria bacterium TMED50]|tara:strand:+ start:1482 stop:2621 length:1140 start_codon:yes stop_codon:yes gene_type:complete
MPHPILQETVTRFEAPTHHYSLLCAPGGELIAFQDGALKLTDDADDSVIWDRQGNTLTHVVSETTLNVKDGRVTVTVEDQQITSRIAHGPENMPSEYLAHISEQGWCCITSVLDPGLVEALEKIGCTDRYAGREMDRSQNMLLQSPAIAKTAAEPISLWVTRQYLGLDDICIGHPPGLAIVDKDDGKRPVLAWHSDYPYHWGVPARGKVPPGTGATCLGLQRNVCVSPFTKEDGATAFKLGSHRLDQPPPEEWGTAIQHSRPGYREEHGLPYGGPEADVVEAPGGSIILYDSRTWHRTGVNQSGKRRAALLQAMIPMYILPKNDTTRAWKQVVESDVYNDLTEREKREFERLMVHRFIGPGGRFAITGDSDLGRDSALS